MKVLSCRTFRSVGLQSRPIHRPQKSVVEIREVMPRQIMDSFHVSSVQDEAGIMGLISSKRMTDAAKMASSAIASRD